MDKKNKHALQVSALCNGTVIDHIPADKLFAVVSLLDIPSMSNNVTIGYNLESKKLGKKGLIKIADCFLKPALPSWLLIGIRLCLNSQKDIMKN